MSRFASNGAKKRQIIPNLIECDEPTTMPPISTNHNGNHGQREPSGHTMVHQYQHQPTAEEAIMHLASNTIREALGEPLARIQSDLEAKISNVLDELDTLKRKDEILTAKLIEKSSQKRDFDQANEELKTRDE
jgi:hypothetical protein